MFTQALLRGFGMDVGIFFFFPHRSFSAMCFLCSNRAGLSVIYSDDIAPIPVGAPVTTPRSEVTLE